MASILTGLHPDQHQANAGNEVPGDDFVTLPEALRDLGYRTAAFLSNGSLSPELGFGQGSTSSGTSAWADRGARCRTRGPPPPS